MRYFSIDEDTLNALIDLIQDACIQCQEINDPDTEKFYQYLLGELESVRPIGTTPKLTPEEEARLKILKIHTKEMSIAKGIDYKKIAAETEGLSGADLRALSVEAGMNAIKNKRAKINYKDFTEALDKVKNRLNDAEISEPEGGLYY